MKIQKEATMKVNIIITVVSAAILLSGCASYPLASPCSDYGANCTKAPLNTQFFSSRKDKTHRHEM